MGMQIGSFMVEDLKKKNKFPTAKPTNYLPKWQFWNQLSPNS